MTFSLQKGMIDPSGVIAVIVIDNDGNERRIECESPPHELHLVQIVRSSGYISSSRAFWSTEGAQREREALLTTARRRGLLSVVTTPGDRPPD